MRSFTILVLMSLLTNSSFGQEAFQNYIREYQEKLDNAEAYTVELAEAMPADQYNFKPSEEQMLFSRQLLHIIGNIAWLTNSYLGGKPLEADLKKTDYSKSEIITILKEAFANARVAIADLKPEDLEQEVKFFAGPKSKRQMMALLQDHLTHHRGQLIVYLRLKGIKPPSYRGW